jgi:hypothetical protein
MAGSGTTALATDVSNPANTGFNIMGTGSLSRGYGQTTFGASKNIGDTITANDFNNIRFDLLNASAHQNGTAAALSLAGNVAGVTLINSTDPNAFIPYATTIDNDRFNCHSSRKATVGGGSPFRDASWASSVSAVYTVNFNNANQARYFWNNGGRIRFSSSRTGGDPTAQNASWSSLLTSAGIQDFGGSAVYNWGTGSTSLYSISSSAPYASNTYAISVATNAAAGSATVYNFTLTWSDPYVDPSPGNPPAPEDIVNGRLSYSVEFIVPTGGHAMVGAFVDWVQYQYTSTTGGTPTGG